jgi:hypothetical protein
MVARGISAPILRWLRPLVLLQQLAAGVEVPGYTDKYPPLPGTLPGDPKSLVRNWENVFNDEVLEAMDKEFEEIDLAAKHRGGLRNSKRVTFWIGKETKPRFAIERAVKLLEKHTFPASLGGPKAFNIVGCKYWVQRRGGTESVNFHYDKDEGLASDKMIMRPPPLVGVSHFDNWGAPTIVLNQTTINNGNIDAPAIPTGGFFVFPKRNKHCLHRGDLHHGAPHQHAAAAVPTGKFRLTMVTSWESEKPLEPNCHFIPDSDLPPLIKARRKTTDWSTFGGLSSQLREVEPVDVDYSPAKSQGDIERKIFRLFLGEIAQVDMLKNPQPGVTYYSSWTGREVSKRQRQKAEDGDATAIAEVKKATEAGVAYMGVYEMDLNDQAQMNKIWNQQTPVVIIFYNGEKRRKRIMSMANRMTYELLVNIPLGAAPPVDTFLANTATCGNALKSFNLRKSDCPIAVVHYTKLGDRKFLATEEQGDLPLTFNTLRRFVKQVLSGQRRPNPRATMPPPKKKATRTDL